jgi:hypothetical protein
MSFSRPLADRQRALEDAFFRKESERLLAAMRERETREAQFDRLSVVLGVRDAEVINPLLDLGLKEESVTALVMAPLVAVAWADRNLDNEERHLLLQAKSDFGIAPDSEAGQLLRVWLEHRPHEHLIDAWSAYVGELCKALAPAESARLREDIVSWSRRIAGALEKSFLRGGGPAKEERAVLEKIEQAFANAGTDGKRGGADDVISSMS